MLEIVRTRTWHQVHTFLDDEDGTPSDLSGFSEIRSQIRSKVAIKNAKGIFEHPLVMTVDVTHVGNVTTSQLSRSQTTTLAPGEYLIDMIGVEGGVDISLIDPEPIKVTNRPTQP
jgi:hypothetical protein